MGKQVTVLSEFSGVMGPSPLGERAFKGGDTITYTDAEYAALAEADLRALSTPPVNVADPARLSEDPNSLPVNTVAAATGNVDLELGTNDLTLTGNVTLVFPSDVTVGNESLVIVRLVEDATGGHTVTYPASANFPSGTAPAIVTTANGRNVLEFSTADGGANWDLITAEVGES